MNSTANRTLLIIISAATSLIFLCEASSVHAQNTQPKFSVGDRVEATVNLFSNLSAKEWRKAKILQIFEARNQDIRMEKDNVIVAIADAVISQGSDVVIEPGLLAELNIPNSKSGSIRAKTMSRVVETPIIGKDRTHTISIIVTDKRYVLISRGFAGMEAVCLIDETGVIGAAGFDREPAY